MKNSIAIAGALVLLLLITMRIGVQGSPIAGIYGEDEGTIELRLPGKLRIYGNIMIKFKFHSTFSTTDLFRVQFNTAFIGNLRSQSGH